jgi:hypothetical protein
MATARELLEQADALMRRNRAPVEDDIPLLVDAVPSGEEARIRFPQPQPDVPPSKEPPNTDDVPILTDTVEEIEALSIQGGEESEGVPSMWLEFGHAEPSVIGDAPDSIAIVPPVDLRRPPPVPDEHEFGDDVEDETEAEVPAVDEITFESVPDDEPPAAPPEHEAASTPVVVAGAEASLHALAAVPSLAPASSMPVAPASAAAPSLEPPVTLEAVPGPETISVPASAIVTTSEAAPLAGPAQASKTAESLADAAQWDAIAEEIRMQVLQRIDLFTDTGLRAQLGARLQPIVDRASADLVATINQHVGELLRAYVAEAIEREIESWRRNH